MLGIDFSCLKTPKSIPNMPIIATYGCPVWEIAFGELKKMGVAGHAHNVQVHKGPSGVLGTWMHPLPPPTVKTSGHMNAYSTFACY